MNKGDGREGNGTNILSLAIMLRQTSPLNFSLLLFVSCNNILFPPFKASNSQANIFKASNFQANVFKASNSKANVFKASNSKANVFKATNLCQLPSSLFFFYFLLAFIYLIEIAPTLRLFFSTWTC